MWSVAPESMIQMLDKQSLEALKALILPVWTKEQEVVFAVGISAGVSSWLRSVFSFS